MNARNKTFALLAAAGLALTLTGCATGTDTTTPTTDPYGWTAEGSTLPTGTIGEGATDPVHTDDGFDPGGLTSVKWGEPVTTKGVTVTVGQPVTFTPTADAYPPKAAGVISLKVQVTVKNDSNEAIRPYDVGFTATVMDSQVGSISDYGSGVGNTPGALVLPTRSVNYWLGYATAANDPAFALQAMNLNDRAGLWSATG